MKRYWMIVAVGFVFSFASTAVAFLLKAFHAPLRADYVFVQLLQPGMEVAARLVTDPIGNIALVWCIVVGVNALIYSMLFAAFFWLFRTLGSRHKDRISN
jgi:hypothetical protein